MNYKLIAVFDSPDQGFRGNTSVVIHLDDAPKNSAMAQIAADFNQPATTFLWDAGQKGHYQVRWFAPDAEIGLCGHGSLAAFAFLGEVVNEMKELHLHYPNGIIKGARIEEKKSAWMELEPIPVQKELPVPELLKAGLGVNISAYYFTDNKNLVLLESEADLREMKPDFATLRKMDTFGYAVTAPGDHVDFVSRTLVPHVQQLEDHATGSSHAILMPYWAAKFGKESLKAHQLSRRGGEFYGSYRGGNVKLQGHYSVIAQGELIH